MTEEELQKLLKDTASSLGEHFETVTIIVTHNNPDDEKMTAMMCAGCRNFYAQYGAVKEWIIRREYEIKKLVDAEAETEE